MPQNSRPAPPFGLGSKPTRLTDATKTPFAIACERWMVFHASRCATPYCAFSAGCQPMAVG